MWKDIPKSGQYYAFAKEIDHATLASNNQNFDKCLCCICHNLIMTPLLLRKCQHACCWSCFKEYTNGKLIKDTTCPSCFTQLCEDDVSISPLLEAVIDGLR